MREREILDEASRNIDEGDLNLARRLLGPLVAAGNGEALCLMSTFGAPDELNAQFESRHVEQLHASAKAGFAPAMWTLGTYYEFGDLVVADIEMALRWYEAAARAGHPRAMLRYGAALVRGDCGLTQDGKEGWRLISRGMEAGVEDADALLGELAIAADR